MIDRDDKGNKRPLFFGKWATLADLKRTFWDVERVKHDHADADAKDWDNSEPDPDAA